MKRQNINLIFLVPRYPLTSLTRRPVRVASGAGPRVTSSVVSSSAIKRLDVNEDTKLRNIRQQSVAADLQCMPISKVQIGASNSISCAPAPHATLTEKSKDGPPPSRRYMFNATFHMLKTSSQTQFDISQNLKILFTHQQFFTLIMSNTHFMLRLENKRSCRRRTSEIRLSSSSPWLANFRYEKNFKR